MTKNEFLSALRAKLCGLPEEDLARSVEYYSEMIDDRMEDGLSEPEAVAAVGTVNEIAALIWSEAPLPALVRARVKPKHTLALWEVVLLVLGAPVWLSLLFAAAVVAFSVLLVLWVLVAVVFVVLAALAMAAGACLYSFAAGLLAGQLGQSLAILGAGLTLSGVCIGLFHAARWATKGAAILCRKLFAALKRGIAGKEHME